MYSFIGISVLSACLLIFLSFRLKSNIETVEQSGSFKNYALGEENILYAVPYQGPPNLVFEIETSSHYPTSGPFLLEQRADGFKVKLDLDALHYKWKATGIQKH